MDIKATMTQCNNADITQHRCPGKILKFYANGDNVSCDCPCHTKKELVPA